MRIIKKIIKATRRCFWTTMVKIKCKSYGGGLRVNRKSRVSSNTSLGKNVNFNGINITGNGEVYIGDNFHSGQNIIFFTEDHNYDEGNAIPYDDTYVKKKIVIEDNVWLGTNVIVFGNVTIGEGAIIQAGSAVVSNIPPQAIAGGHPARVFKYRDKDHYEKLKMEKKYH
jgi:acetyltransferase-like isoleucine patch superfamily enzyme